MKLLIPLLFFASSARGAEHWTLEKFLSEVRQKNPEVVATVARAESLEKRLHEGEAVLMTKAFVNYNYLLDKKETAVPQFQGYSTRNTDWKVGLKKDFSMGLSSSAYVETSHTTFSGVLASFVPVADFTESREVLELQQSLWRNGFGSATRANMELSDRSNRADWMRSRYQLKALCLNATSIYWTLATLDEVIRLQNENVARAKRLRDLQNRRANTNLVDDVDALQTEAAYRARELELQQSLNSRSEAARQFFTLIGAEADRDLELDPVPREEFSEQLKSLNKSKVIREDFEASREQGKAGVADSTSKLSNINPDFFLKASVASNGRDGLVSETYAKIGEYNRPTWNIGLALEIPLDFTLIRELKAAFRAQKQSGEDVVAQADYQEKRLWEDLVSKRKEAQGEFERAVEIEKVRSKIVERDRHRLMNGRSTTFQTVTYEQDLAQSQVQKVQAQLVLIKIQNEIQLFTESL